MTKLRLETCPECESDQFGQIETEDADGEWRDVWTCVECGHILYFDGEEEL